MRSTTVFIIIGVVILLVIVSAAMSSRAKSNHPAMVTTLRFLRAVEEQDAATVEATLDGTQATVMRAGSGLSGIDFKEVIALPVAFGKRPAVVWQYPQLVGLKVSTTLDPTYDAEAGLANIPLDTGAAVYLWLKNGEWKIFYLAEPKEQR